MDTIVSAMTTEMTDVISSLQDAITTIAPIALPLLGFVLVVTVGIGVFKKVTKASAR